jgi:hypothetical protein
MRIFLHISLLSCICLSLFFLLSGCAPKRDALPEEILRAAGKNRRELQRVITHYSADPADSLKLKAARFLILNMPGKYSEYYENPWADVATVRLRWSSSSDKQRVMSTYGLGTPTQKSDLTHITAAYLIANIDQAFQVWNDKPWGKHVPFDTFCEEILPYRIGTEPLENWRERVLASFADLDAALREDTAMTAVEACRRVNDLLPRFRLDKDFANMNFTQMMATTRGPCDSQAALAIFVMRGLGIPVTFDFTPHWKNHPSGHSWNSVCDSAGHHISFMGTESNPGDAHQGSTYVKAKAYRRTYGHHRATAAAAAADGDEHIPPLFRRNMYDISSEHPDMDSLVTVPMRYPPEEPSANAFLALFYDFEWRLTGHGETDGDSIRFRHIGKRILYLPVRYAGDSQMPAGDPFYLDAGGEVHNLPPDLPDSLMTFCAITPENDVTWNWRMINAVFESADDSVFSAPRTLFTITDTPRVYNRVLLKRPRTCRYIRYLSPAGSGNVSEISFHDASGEKLSGKHIGLPGSYHDQGDTGDKAFDGNTGTFYDAAEEDNSWTGLDFGEEKTVASVRYSPRFLGVGIYAGHEYTLNCWTAGGWKQVAKKTATDVTVEFNVPRGALLYLNNNTLKRKGRVFFILNGDLFYYNQTDD